MLHHILNIRAAARRQVAEPARRSLPYHPGDLPNWGAGPVPEPSVFAASTPLRSGAPQA
jgi:hypothetical protein